MSAGHDGPAMPQAPRERADGGKIFTLIFIGNSDVDRLSVVSDAITVLT